jgi:hypothetical protein
VPVKGRAADVKQADVVEVFSQDVCVSVNRDNGDSRAICTVNSEHLVDKAVVVPSLFAVFDSRPPI